MIVARSAGRARSMQLERGFRCVTRLNAAAEMLLTAYGALRVHLLDLVVTLMDSVAQPPDRATEQIFHSLGGEAHLSGGVPLRLIGQISEDNCGPLSFRKRSQQPVEDIADFDGLAAIVLGTAPENWKFLERQVTEIERNL